VDARRDAKTEILVQGYFEEVSEQEMRGVFDSNLFGAMALTRAVQVCLVEPAFRRYLSGKMFNNVWSGEMTKRVTGTRG
jgi:NAD(P)-dependent dehydrogenase (short-subunit alcohol dehydrogenase family)